MMNESFLSLTGALLTVVLVLVLAYWCSRFMGKAYMKASSGQNLKVMEQVRVGTDKQILLVKLKSHRYLIGISQAGIQMLAELDEKEFEQEEGDEANE